MNKKRWLLGVAVALALLWFAVRWGVSTVAPQHSLGSEQGRLAPCPDSPNCVSSFAEDAEHRVDPLTIADSTDEAIERLQSIVAAMPGASIVTADPRYLHAEFRSTLLGFVDDVELLLDEQTGVVHIRSSSRVGHSDLGVNRRRMEELRRRFESQ